MLKVTIKFTVCLFFLSAGCSSLLSDCTGKTDHQVKTDSLRQVDSVSEARIDSANTAINVECDTALLYTVPRLADSLMNGDTAYLKSFFDSAGMYNDEDKKVEKVVRQLKADCDSNLLKETYKTMQRLQKAKRWQHKRKKV